MSLSLSFGGKRVDTVKPSGLGACVRDKVPVCCRLSTQMRPRRGKGANRRGSQSIDRVRYGMVRVQITTWQRACNGVAVERSARWFEAGEIGEVVVRRSWVRVQVEWVGWLQVRC